jgi:heme oxygenase-like protein
MTSIRGSTTRAKTVLPPVRGVWTEALYALLDSPGRSPAEASEVTELCESADTAADVLSDDDLQMALYLCYEMHYAGIEGVDERMEWSPVVLMFRGALEEAFEAAVRAIVPPREGAPASVGDELQRLIRADDGPSLSRFAEFTATDEQLREHVIHRSAYQLKEADPHSWAIPRLAGAVKAALVEIQADEYGGGRPERMHSTLFANTMRGLGLDPAYGAYLDLLPGITLATVNLVSWFGLHRRLRGSLVGHLAVFEMTSSVPNRRYGNGLRRLGYGPEVTDFYDEHVEADAVHESIAAWDLADGLARTEPDLAADVIFGAEALLAIEGRWGAHLLEAWGEDRTSLLRPLP